jgi:hypothetical protein
MELPKEFFTLESMLTLSGATGATVIVANGIQRAFNYNPKWLALVIAQLISLYGVYLTSQYGSDYFVGVINGFLIFCTAAGVTSAVGRLVAPRTAHARSEARLSERSLGRRGFFSSWF